MTDRDPILMAGIPELIVMSLLAAREMYGYELARSIKLLTESALSLGEGVLYPALHTMEMRGLLRSRCTRMDGRTRIYYRLTPRGRRRLGRLKANWRRMSRGVESILGAPIHV
ncbi:MAG TPA: helix-turn-helix transcriptional regulator [Candidatus Binataceae bacterium]|nr:helix-turn-helix transcriptional regulator [Candidatus Binataceae bacterium]